MASNSLFDQIHCRVRKVSSWGFDREARFQRIVDEKEITVAERPRHLQNPNWSLHCISIVGSSSSDCPMLKASIVLRQNWIHLCEGQLCTQDIICLYAVFWDSTANYIPDQRNLELYGSCSTSLSISMKSISPEPHIRPHLAIQCESGVQSPFA